MRFDLRGQDQPRCNPYGYQHLTSPMDRVQHAERIISRYFGYFSFIAGLTTFAYGLYLLF